MIKIRYRDPNELSPGLHAAAERHGRSTVVYLLSGLTAQERRAALRRLRLSARMGYCPQLPTAQLAVALLADRIRTSAGHTGAIFRSHPAGSTVPVMVVSAGAIAFLVLSTVSIRVLHDPRAANQSPASGKASVGPASAVPVSGSPQSRAGGGPGGPGDPGQAGSVSRMVPQPGSGGSGSSAQPGSGAGTGTSSGGGSGSGSGSSGTGSGGGGTTLGKSSDPAPAFVSAAASTAPAVSFATAVASAPASLAAPKPAAAATASPGGVCLDVGPLGICLHV
jgi:hypothetical protein